MIFESDPQQIEALDSKQLVQLMKLVLLAESRLAQIPLRGTHVPFQITVADGGLDGTNRCPAVTELKHGQAGPALGSARIRSMNGQSRRPFSSIKARYLELNHLARPSR
jgi:hypothetical protein